MADLLKGWGRKQRAYRRLPRIIRYPLLALAFLLLPAGVIAMFTPLAVLEVGSIFIFTSLTILSFEFNWAHKLLDMLHRKLQDRGARKGMLIFAVAILVMYAALIVLNVAR